MIATCQCNMSQHCWEQHITPTCDMLRGVGCYRSNLKMAQHLWMFHDVVVILSGLCNMGTCTSLIFDTQHVVTRYNTVAKYAHVVPNNVVFNCFDRLVGVCKCWANNVICHAEMLQLFGWGFKFEPTTPNIIVPTCRNTWQQI